MCGEADYGERVDALDALIKLNDSRLEAVTTSMEANPGIWSDELIKTSILKLFPAHVSAERLCGLLSRVVESPRSIGGFAWLWPRAIASADMSPDYVEALRVGLTDLVIEGVEWRKEWSHLVTPRQYLVSSLAAICLRILKNGLTSVSVVNSSVIALRCAREDYSRHEPASELREKLGQQPASVRAMAFWADDAFIQTMRSQEDPWKRLFEANYQGAVSLNSDQDADWISACLADSQRPLAERAMMLEAVIHEIWAGPGEWRDYMLGMKSRVADCPQLLARIDECLKPPPANPELAKMEQEHQKRRKQEERQQAKAHASWVRFWQEVGANPQTAFSSDKAVNTAWNLWRAMARSGQESRASGWNRRFLEQHFSKEIADQMRTAIMSIWRKDHPTLRSERPENEKGTFLARWQLGLAAIAAEAEDPNWAQKLSTEEAELATRYSPIELNGFPSWLEGLAASHPSSIDTVLGSELASELEEVAAGGQTYSMLLQNVSHAPHPLAALFFPRLTAWLDKSIQSIGESGKQAVPAERLQQVLNILLKHGDGQACAHIREIALAQLADHFDATANDVWLPILMRLNPLAATERLEQSLSEITPTPDGPGGYWIGALFGDRGGAQIDLRKPEFSPALLLRLVRIAYRFVPPSEDIRHEGVYSPGSRDHAQEGRSALLSALLDAKGPDAWAAKLELANDPLFANFRDRALLIAREKAAEECDRASLSEAEVVAFNRNGEIRPATRDEMFALLIDRLDDLDELLLRDDSPRATWALINDEKMMRREIARELRNAANHAYTVDQESVTADEKETDIRLRATSGQQAVIELKIGDERSGRDLRDTIREQLVTKYMAPEVCRSGCLLVTISKKRTWEHPDSHERLDIAGMESMLQAEASKIVAEMGLTLSLTARALDLLPRLTAENNRSQ